MNSHHMSKRRRQAILFFTYGFMTLATLFISAVCLMLVMGYKFDVSHGRIEQGGLLQFRSIPTGANVSVDGLKQSFLTPGKLDVNAGRHTVIMSKTGYGNWQKTVPVKAGELRWLNYARLVPTNIATKTHLTTGQIESALSTPDRKFVATVIQSASPQVVVYDVRDPQNIKEQKFEIPPVLLGVSGDQIATVAIAEWDFGSRFLLLTSKVGDTISYIRIDSRAVNGEPVNISKEFNLPFRDMHFSGTSGQLYYALTGQDLRKIDLGAKSVTQPLVTGVSQYVLYKENDIAYVSSTPTAVNAGVYLDGKSSVVRTYGSQEKIVVDISEYYSKHYLAVTAKNRLSLIRDPSNQTASQKDHASFPIPSEASWLDFANSGRFITAGAGYTLTTYDIETSEQHLISINSDASTQRPKWLDDFYFVDNTAGKARIYEYDGLNEHSIVTAEPNLPVFLSEDGEYLYSFSRQNDKVSLQSSRLVID